MNKILLGTVATFLTTQAVAVAAQDLTYGRLNASIGQLSEAGVEVDATVISGEVGYAFGAVDLFLSGSRVELSQDGTSIALEALSLGAGYTIARNYRADVSASNIDLAGADLRLTEIGFAYDNGQLFARASYGSLDADGAGTIDDVLGLHVGYAVNDELSFSISAHTADVPAGTIDPVIIVSAEYDVAQYGVELDYVSTNLGGLNLSLLSLAGDYQITDQWGVNAGYSNADLAGADIDTFRIGGTYSVNDQYSFYAGYQRASSGGDDVDGFSLGVSFDIGSKPSSYETTSDRLSGALGSFSF
jgi:hypothetical protein